MASTYSSNLALELMGTGDQAGSWGTTTNVNLGTLIEQAIVGYTTTAMTTNADTTITIPNGATGEARNMYIEIPSSLTLTAARVLTVPNNKKLYFVFNNSTGGFAVTVKVSGQTGVSVPNGAKMALVCNGTDVVNAVNYFSSLTLGAALPVASGGTGSTTLTANNVLLGNGTSALQVVAPGANGNILYSNGTIWSSSTPSAASLLATSTIGVTVQGYDANTAKTNVVQSFSVAQRGTITALTDGATITPDFSAANNFSLTIGGNRTLANPTNQTAGQSGAIVITQDATGGRTLAYGSNWKFSNGSAPTLTTTASAVDVIAYYVESASRITARWIGDVK